MEGIFAQSSLRMCVKAGTGNQQQHNKVGIIQGSRGGQGVPNALSETMENAIFMDDNKGLLIVKSHCLESSVRKEASC